MVMYAGLTDADKAAVWTRLHADTWSGLQAGGHRFDPGTLHSIQSRSDSRIQRFGAAW